jgi:hypothetical protein
MHSSQCCYRFTCVHWDQHRCCKGHAEINVTVPDHFRNAAFANVALESYVLDVGKSLDAQQFSGDILRRNASYRYLGNPNRSDFRRRLRGVRLSAAAQAGEANPAEASGTNEGELRQKILETGLLPSTMVDVTPNEIEGVDGEV